MYCQRHVVTLTTAVGGAVTGYTPNITGRVLSIRYVKTDFATGVDFTITGEATGVTIWTQENVNASTTCYPRQATHSTAGVASLYASGGEAVNDHIYLANERIKFAIASGGDAKTGVFHVITG